MQNRVINVWINVAQGTSASAEIIMAACTKSERATISTCPCFMKPIGNFYESAKILFRSQLLFLVVLSEMKSCFFHKSSSHRCITLSYLVIHDVLLRLIKAISSWFPHRDAEMKQLLYHQSLVSFSSLCSFIFVWNILGPSNKCSHVRRAHFTVEVDFYFMLTHLLDVIIEILGYLVEPPVSSPLVPAECLHHLREGLWKDVYTSRLCT